MITIWPFYFFVTFICFRRVFKLNCYRSKKKEKRKKREDIKEKDRKKKKKLKKKENKKEKKMKKEKRKRSSSVVRYEERLPQVNCEKSELVSE